MDLHLFVHPCTLAKMFITRKEGREGGQDPDVNGKLGKQFHLVIEERRDKQGWCPSYVTSTAIHTHTRTHTH